MPSATQDAPAFVTFRTTLFQEPGRNPTGIVIPADLVDALGHGKRPPVRVRLNDYEYRSTIAVMGGRFLVGVSAAVREATGLAGGDDVDVMLTVDATPREAIVPDDFAAALDAVPGTRAFFDDLSNSLRRYHIDNVTGTKNPETRQRRVAKAVELFRAGRPR